MKRPWYLTLIAIVVGVDTVNAFAQVVYYLINKTDSPGSLTIWQAAVGLTGLTAALQVWQQRSSAAVVLLVHALTLSGMLFFLPEMVGIDGDGARGVRASAAMIFAVLAACAYIVHRATRAR